MSEALDKESVFSLIDHVTDYRAEDNGKETIFKETARKLYEKNRAKHEEA